MLDPFSGSGTTLRVCQQLNRNCIGFELNPEYVQLTERRLTMPFTGFDSIDARLERVPLDLRSEQIRNEYIKNHIKWFLAHHENYIPIFQEHVRKMYSKTSSQSKSTQIKLITDEE